jgi:hypothetical protein
MKNLKNYDEFNKVNEGFELFGMEVVIPIGDVVGGALAIFFLVAFGLALGVAKVKFWVKDILRDKRKRRALKSASAIINKYKDDIVKDFIHKLRLEVDNQESFYRGKISKIYTDMMIYLKGKMTKDDEKEFDIQMRELGLTEGGYVGPDVKNFVYKDVWERKNII